jgi:hypothetical protein
VPAPGGSTPRILAAPSRGTAHHARSGGRGTLGRTSQSPAQRWPWLVSPRCGLDHLSPDPGCRRVGRHVDMHQLASAIHHSRVCRTGTRTQPSRPSLQLALKLIQVVLVLAARPRVESRLDFSPVRVVVLPMRLTITSRLTSGRPRQFRVMWQNKRCSITFHLLVLGGRWDTLRRRPVASASRWSSVFHRRLWLPLLPPLSDAGDGEGRCLVIDADAHPALIGGDVVDPVRNGVAQLLSRKSCTRTASG